MPRKPEEINKVFQAIAQQTKTGNQTSQQLSLFDTEESIGENSAYSKASSIIHLPVPHPIPSPRYLDKMLYQLYERPPENYQGLLEQKGVGPSTLRALAMVAEITHGAKPAFHDPVRYAFAHGGKDGFPFPVERNDIQQSLNVLRTAIEKGKIGENDKLESLRRLAKRQKLIESHSAIE